MDERATDKLLSELFQRNAASVNETALRDRINGKLWRIRKRRRRNRTAKIVAVGFASVVLVVAAVFATLRATEYFQDESPLVFTDLTPGPADAAAGWGTDNPAGLARVAPVMGTAVLEQTKDEGTSEPPTGAGSTQWIRDRVEVYRLSTSQPLVSGTMEITFD